MDIILKSNNTCKRTQTCVTSLQIRSIRDVKYSERDPSLCSGFDSVLKNKIKKEFKGVSLES